MVKMQATNKIKSGYPLLVKGDFVKEPSVTEGTLVELIDQQKKFVASAYLAKQNKGDGWILSLNPQEKINQKFCYTILTLLFFQLRPKRLKG